jgi:hypothetical protein
VARVYSSFARADHVGKFESRFDYSLETLGALRTPLKGTRRGSRAGTLQNKNMGCIFIGAWCV